MIGLEKNCLTSFGTISSLSSNLKLHQSQSVQNSITILLASINTHNGRKIAIECMLGGSLRPGPYDLNGSNFILLLYSVLSVMLNCSPIVSLYSSRRKSRHGRRLKRRGSELQRFSSSNSATMRKWRTKWRKWITTRWCRRRHNNAFYRCERIAASRKLRFSSPYWWASMKKRVRPSWKRNKIMLASNSSSSICNAWTKSGRAELNSMKRSLSRKRRRPEAAKLQKQEPPSLGRLRKSNA